jgi:hypothetical protein
MSQNGLCPSYGAKAFGNQAIKNLYDEIGCFGVLANGESVRCGSLWPKCAKFGQS